MLNNIFSKIFSTTNKAPNLDEAFLTFGWNLAEVEDLILSKYHKEKLEVFKSLKKDEWSFDNYQGAKELAEEIKEYHRKYHKVLQESHDKEFWIKWIIGWRGFNGFYGIQNYVNTRHGDPWIAIDGVPFKVVVGGTPKRPSLKFVCLDPWDEGTQLEIREEVEKMNLPFEIDC